MVNIPRELQSQNVGKYISGAACVYVSEVCERCVSGKINDYERSGIFMLELGKVTKIPDLWCMSTLLGLCPET